MLLGTSINPDDPDFQDNAAAYQKHLNALNNYFQQLLPGHDDPLLVRHRERGKLFVRDRIDSLLDPGTPFLEIGALTGADIYDGVRPGAGLVTGVGCISGKNCMVIGNDATVKGGCYFPLTVKKHLRAQEIAVENKLPCVYLVDSGGAFLPMQDQVFPDREHFGRIFYNQARMSSLGIPQLAAVMGSCTAGGAYVPAMSDEAIIVANQGTIFLGGPPLVKAATGEEISAEELGGGAVHSKISGVTDHLAANDMEAIQMLRTAVANLGQPPRRLDAESSACPPAYSPEEIYGLIPEDPRKHFPMREILARIIDGSEFDEFKANYGTSLICGFARIQGFLVGVIANDGILFSESALKGTHFIQLCNQRDIPIVFFQNIVGFMVGKEYEHGGIAKDGAKMVNAVACARVPKYTVIVGGSFGAGNYAMCGRAYQPRTIFSWPHSRTAVMGPEQAAGVLTMVRSESYRSRGKQWTEKDESGYRQEIEDKYNTEARSFYASARLWDDGVINPVDTRRILALSLAMTAQPEKGLPAYGVFRT